MVWAFQPRKRGSGSTDREFRYVYPRRPVLDSPKPTQRPFPALKPSLPLHPSFPQLPGSQLSPPSLSFHTHLVFSFTIKKAHSRNSLQVNSFSLDTEPLYTMIPACLSHCFFTEIFLNLPTCLWLGTCQVGLSRGRATLSPQPPLTLLKGSLQGFWDHLPG